MVLFLGQPWLDTKVLFLFAINGKISPNQQKNRVVDRYLKFTMKMVA